MERDLFLTLHGSTVPLSVVTLLLNGDISGSKIYLFCRKAKLELGSLLMIYGVRNEAVRCGFR